MAANWQKVISYLLPLLLLVLSRTHHFFRVASDWSASFFVYYFGVAAGSGVWAFTVHFFINFVINMLYVELQIFLVLNVNVIQELRAWHVCSFSCSPSYLRALKAINIFPWIHRRFLFIMMNCVSSLHIPWVHSSPTFRINVTGKLHRSCLIPRAFPWLPIILYQCTVNS